MQFIGQSPKTHVIANQRTQHYGAIATVTERSEEMPVVQSTYFDSLRGAPPRGQCVLGALRFVATQTRSVTFLLCKFQFVVPMTAAP